MAEKCDLCKTKIETTFLNKIKGAYIGRGKKRKIVCSNCQKKFGNNIGDEFV